MVFAVPAANPVKCILVPYAGTLYVGTVIINIKIFVIHVKGLKPVTLLNHSNKYLNIKIIKLTYL
jgi:hypothetical protein